MGPDLAILQRVVNDARQQQRRCILHLKISDTAQRFETQRRGQRQLHRDREIELLRFDLQRKQEQPRTQLQRIDPARSDSTHAPSGAKRKP